MSHALFAVAGLDTESFVPFKKSDLGGNAMPGIDRQRTISILDKLKQRTALDDDELADLQTSLGGVEAALAGSHHFAQSHHTKVALEDMRGVLDRR
jgi:hypothetical protein